MGRQQAKAWTESRALIGRCRQYLIAKTGAGVDTPWEFPGGRIGPRESPEAGMRRLSLDLLGVDLEISLGQPPFVYHFGDHSVTYRYYVCGVQAEPAALGYAELRWVPKAQLCEYVFDAPTQQVVDWLLQQPHRR